MRHTWRELLTPSFSALFEPMPPLKATVPQRCIRPKYDGRETVVRGQKGAKTSSWKRTFYHALAGVLFVVALASQVLMKKEDLWRMGDNLGRLKTSRAAAGRDQLLREILLENARPVYLAAACIGSLYVSGRLLDSS